MNFLERILRPQIFNLNRLRDEDTERMNFLRLDKNERLLPFPDDLITQFKERITFDSLSAYYDLAPLYKKLSKSLGVKKEQTHIAAGSDLAIKSIFEACAVPNDNIILHAPSYGMYRIYAKMFGLQERIVPVKNDWIVNLEGMLEQVNQRTKLVVIENPNGFVGTKPLISDIIQLASELYKRNTILLLDEAYNYVENTECVNRDLVQKFPNVIISQSFSKAHGLAGLRVGYLVGEAKLVQHISRVRPMHEISSIAAIAADCLLDNANLIEDYQMSIAESKKYLFKSLDYLQVPCRDTHANFILLYMPNKGLTSNITQRLYKHGILIRRPFEEQELEGWVRVCVGDKNDSKQFIEALDLELASPVAAFQNSKEL